MGKVARWFKGVFGTTSKNRERQNQDGFSETTKLPTRLSTDTKKVSDVKCAKLTGGDIIITREERRAAVTIQKVFRGSLARKALRALKGIVKLQALVRGFLVRKRAAAMLESIETLIRLQTAARTKRINRCTNKENRKTNQPRQSIDKFDASADDERSKIVEMDDVFKRRLKCKQVRDVSEYEEDFVYNGNEMVLRLPGEKRKFATAQNTPRFFFASHQHAGNNRYYAKQSMAKGNTLCDNETNSPGYMEKTQSFKAKLRSHSAPRQRTERKRLSLDEVLASRNSDASVGMVQPQRYSCCYYPY